MKKLYESGNVIEAEYIVQKLAARGIDAKIVESSTPFGQRQYQIFSDDISDDKIKNLIDSILPEEKKTQLKMVKHQKSKTQLNFEPATIGQRFLAITIDSILILFLFMIPAYIFPHNESGIAVFKAIFSYSVMFLYIPICTSYGCTLGQRLMGIRVQTLEGERISIFKAIPRYFFQCLLGWLSFVTLLFSSRQRAIHDFAVGTVVVKVRH